MAFNVVVKLLDSHGTAMLETTARQWNADAVRRQLEGVKWIDVSQDPGYSDLTAELDASAALRLHEHFGATYRSWITFYAELAQDYRSNGELTDADDHQKVSKDAEAELAALTEIVRRAGLEGLKVSVLLEEWSSGY